MKKSLLNIAISIAMSSALLSGSVLNTQAYAGELSSSEKNTASHTDNNEATLETYMYPGMGAGAAAGTLVAGPVGFLIGGLVGAVIGAKQEVKHESEANSESDVIANLANTREQNASEPGTPDQGLLVAQIGPVSSVMQNANGSQQDELVNILTTDLSLDVYFRSGSADIESFYPARLAALANLMNNIDSLELHLDGYTDRRGNQTENTALANERINKVREQLVNAGVEDSRIISNALGETNMTSSAGDLEAYAFDRRVVIRFQRTSPDSIQSMTTALSSLTTEETTTESRTNVTPVVADASARF